MSQRLFCPHTEDSACNANRQDKLNKEINKKKENCVKDANMVIATYEGLINRRGLIRANHRYTSISDADIMDKPTQP